jgi:hypothetical protein
MFICLRRPTAALPSSSGPHRNPSHHPRRFAFILAGVATLLLPHAAAQPLRLGGGVPAPPGVDVIHGAPRGGGTGRGNAHGIEEVSIVRTLNVKILSFVLTN